MTPSHHVPFDLLMERAAGTLSPAMALFVDTHVALCPLCRGQLRALEAVGGEMLERIAPVAMSAGALDRMMALIGAEAQPRPIMAATGMDFDGDPAFTRLPSVLRPVWARSRPRHDWRKVFSGVSMMDLDVPENHDGKVLLTVIEGDKGIPRHSHRGREAIIVLSGAFQDEFGRFGKGDVCFCDGAMTHKPVAEPGEICVALAVLELPVQLTG